MTITGRATLAMIHAIIEDTWDRVWDWFHQHPEAQFAYWGKDEFLSDKATDKEKQEFVKRHPEIDDLNDHTTVHILNDQIMFATFCPRLKAGIKEIYESEYIHEIYNGISLTVTPDNDNFIVTVSK